MLMQQLLDQLRSDRPVNWSRLQLEQAVEVAAAGEQFIREMVENERAADDLAIRTLDPSGVILDAFSRR